MDLAGWTAKLLITACLLAGYKPPPRVPQVRALDSDALAAAVCAGACEARGAYMSELGVLIANGLDLDRSPRDRSILLHELVHYLQDISGRFADEAPCDRWRDREIEAYHVQELYLDRYNMGVGNVAAAMEVAPAVCQPGQTSVQLFRDRMP